jgi:YihY family inner membrane protein
MQAAERLLRRADRQQQKRAWIAFPYAVIKKFGDDQAGNLAALIAYYGFLSLFPLMLVLVTLLGMLLRNNSELQGAIQASALANFPVIGEQISSNVHSLRGSGLALGIGLAVALWAGLGVVKVLQTAMNAVWNVPYRHRPNVWVSLLRAMLMLVVLGVITIASAAAGGFGAGSDSWLLGIAGIATSVMLNLIMFLLAFRILTTEDVTWGDVFTGASVAALSWTALQALGGYIVSHQLQGASDTYGTFAIVIGLRVDLPWRTDDAVRCRGERRQEATAVATSHRPAAPHRRRRTSPQELRETGGAKARGSRQRPDRADQDVSERQASRLM